MQTPSHVVISTELQSMEIFQRFYRSAIILYKFPLLVFVERHGSARKTTVLSFMLQFHQSQSKGKIFRTELRACLATHSYPRPLAFAATLRRCVFGAINKCGTTVVVGL